MQDREDEPYSKRLLGKGVLVALVIMTVLIGLGYLLVRVGS